jgi:hypothetical protein
MHSTKNVIPFAALVIALFIAGNADHRTLLQVTLGISAAFIVLHALRAEAGYFWGTLGGIALMSNPVFRLLPGRGFFVVNLISMAVFLVYYRVCVAERRFCIASIANREALTRQVSS